MEFFTTAPPELQYRSAAPVTLPRKQRNTGRIRRSILRGQCRVKDSYHPLSGSLHRAIVHLCETLAMRGRTNKYIFFPTCGLS